MFATQGAYRGKQRYNEVDSDVSLTKWVLSESIERIAWHMCAVMLWEGGVDEIDRRCTGMVVEETGMIGNDMGKAIKNWETQDD